MRRLRWKVAYWSSRLGMLLPRRLIPTRIAYACALPIADLCYHVFASDRRTLIANLTRVLGDPAAARKAARRAYRNYGRYIIDLFQLPVLDRAALRRRVEFDDWQVLNDSGVSKGTIFVTLHLGQWEMGAAALAAYGYPISVIAQTLEHGAMDDLVQGFRREMGMRTIPGEKARAEVFRCLARNGMLGMLIDVVEPGEGVKVDFFGAPAEMSGAPARIALRTGARVVSAVLARDPLDPTRLRPVIDAELGFTPSGDEEADVAALTQSVARSLESLVRRFPDQWFAFHALWPRPSKAGAASGEGPRKLLALEFVVRLFGRLPRALTYAVAALAGDLAYWRRTGARRDVEDNMRHVLGPSARDADVARSAREVFRNVGRYYADLIRLPRISAKRLLEREVTVQGIDNLRRATAGGRGVVIASGHFGNPELTLQISYEIGINLLALSEPLNPPEFSQLVHGLRSANGIPYEEIGFRAIAHALDHLRAGGSLGIACDRDIQGTGAVLSFFGEKTRMPLGAVELAARTGAALVPVFCPRRGKSYDVVFEPALTMVSTGSPKQDALVNARALLDRVEDWIRRDPGQWMVLERIWKPLPAPSSRRDEAALQPPIPEATATYGQG